jgi:hypothetical protein
LRAFHFQSVAGLFLYRPAESLNLIARYLARRDLRPMPAFLDVVRFFFGLWSLAYDSVLAVRYVCLLRFLLSECPELFQLHPREIIGILSRFLACGRNDAIAAAGALLAQLYPQALRPPAAALLALAQDEARCASFDVIWLAAPALPDAPAVLPILVARAASAPDNKAWVLLIKYARQGEAHARSLLGIEGWLLPQMQPLTGPLRLLLCVFAYPALRLEAARLPAVARFLTALCVPEQAEMIHLLTTLLLRLPADVGLLRHFSGTGLVHALLAAALQSANPVCVRCGITFVDAFARAGYADEWVGAVHVFAGLLRNRQAEFGDDLVRTLAALSPFPPCIAALKETGVVQYFYQIAQMPKFADCARFLLANAANTH